MSAIPLNEFLDYSDKLNPKGHLVPDGLTSPLVNPLRQMGLGSGEILVEMRPRELLHQDTYFDSARGSQGFGMNAGGSQRLETDANKGITTSWTEVTYWYDIDYDYKYDSPWDGRGKNVTVLAIMQAPNTTNYGDLGIRQTSNPNTTPADYKTVLAGALTRTVSGVNPGPVLYAGLNSTGSLFRVNTDPFFDEAQSLDKWMILAVTMNANKTARLGVRGGQWASVSYTDDKPVNVSLDDEFIYQMISFPVNVSGWLGLGTYAVWDGADPDEYPLTNMTWEIFESEHVCNSYTVSGRVIDFECTGQVAFEIQTDNGWVNTDGSTGETNRVFYSGTQQLVTEDFTAIRPVLKNEGLLNADTIAVLNNVSVSSVTVNQYAGKPRKGRTLLHFTMDASEHSFALNTSNFIVSIEHWARGTTSYSVLDENGVGYHVELERVFETVEVGNREYRIDMSVIRDDGASGLETLFTHRFDRKVCKELTLSYRDDTNTFTVYLGARAIDFSGPTIVPAVFHVIEDEENSLRDIRFFTLYVPSEITGDIPITWRKWYKDQLETGDGYPAFADAFRAHRGQGDRLFGDDYHWDSLGLFIDPPEPADFDSREDDTMTEWSVLAASDPAWDSPLAVEPLADYPIIDSYPVTGNSLFGMEITSVTGIASFEVETTGALFVVSSSGITLASRIDSETNQNVSPVTVGSITFATAQSDLEVTSSNKQSVIIESSGVTLTIRCDSTLQIQPKAIPFNYTYTSGVTAAWTQYAETGLAGWSDQEVHKSKIWTNGKRGTFRSISSPGCSITENSADSSTMSFTDTSSSMLHMVFPARFYNFAAIYGSELPNMCTISTRYNLTDITVTSTESLQEHVGLILVSSSAFTGNTIFPPGGWISDTEGSTIDRRMTAYAEYDGNLYVCGSFTEQTYPSSESIAYIGYLSGGSLVSIGGLSGGEVRPRAMCEFNGKLYVGGCFYQAGSTSVNHIAAWNGVSWEDVGGGLSGGGTMPGVFAMVEFDGKLYVGGKFTDAGGVTVSNLAVWDGAAWSDVDNGVGGDEGYVLALEAYDTVLAVGGSFTTVGSSISAENIALYDPTGAGWSAIASNPRTGIENMTLSLHYDGSDLYVAGGWISSGGRKAQVHTYDGSWTLIGEFTGQKTGVGPYVFSVQPYNGAICAAGDFQYLSGSSDYYNCIASWNGAAWSRISSLAVDNSSSGFNGAVYAIHDFGTDLYAGGEFSVADGNSRAAQAYWNGAAWTRTAEVDTGRPEKGNRAVVLEEGPYRGYRGYEYRDPEKMASVFSDLKALGFRVIQYFQMSNRDWKGQSWQDSLDWIVWFLNEYNIDGAYFDNAQIFAETDVDDRWWNTYQFLKGLRERMGNDFVIYHHSSVDVVGGRTGVTCTPVETYATFSLRGETGDIAYVENPNDTYLRYYVCQHGMAQTIGTWIIRSDRTTPFSVAEWARSAYRLHGAGYGRPYATQWDEWATYADDIYLAQQTAYNNGTLDMSLDWLPSWFTEVSVDTTIGSTTVTCEWSTSQAADSQLIYAESGNPIWDSTAIYANPVNAAIYDATLTTSHSLEITGLSPSTEYVIRIRSVTGTGANALLWGAVVVVTTTA